MKNCIYDCCCGQEKACGGCSCEKTCNPCQPKPTCPVCPVCPVCPACPTCPTCPACPTCPTCPETAPFLSSYAEGAADTQAVVLNGDIIFKDADIVGTDISFTAPGSVFTINRTGLYQVEWSANVNGGIVMGILENNNSASATSHSGAAGNIASGSLINVTAVPFAVSLRSFSGNVQLSSLTNYENTAASIRIIRIADGAKV